MWSEDISLAYAGDGSRIAIGTNEPFEVVVYENGSKDEGEMQATQEWLPANVTGSFNSDSVVKILDLFEDGNILAIASIVNGFGITSVYKIDLS